MKLLIAFIFLFVICSCGRDTDSKATNVNAPDPVSASRKKPDIPDTVSVAAYSDLDIFLKSHRRYNQDLVFFINMKLHSRTNRFFVLNMQSRSIIDRGMVAQGANTKPDATGTPVFSNEVGSNCTSLGKYRIGEKYKGRFGPAFRLHGLEATNSNALKRFVVLHGYSSVPDSPQEYDICYSLGCPMVSPNFLTKLENIIDHSEKPILLNIQY